MVYNNWRILSLFCLVFLAAVLHTSCNQPPEEVGVFLETEKGWVKMPSFGYDGFSGGFEGTEETSNIPPLSNAKRGGVIRLQAVKVDPSELYIGKRIIKENYTRSKTRWNIEDNPAHAEVKSLGDEVFEVKIPTNLKRSVYVLVAKAGQFSARGYFFQVK